MASEDLYFHALQSISPIDGRHRIITGPLAEWYSEFAFLKYMVKLEIEYLIALSDLDQFLSLRSFTKEEKRILRNIVDNFSLKDAQIIQDIDRFGHNGQKP